MCIRHITNWCKEKSDFGYKLFYKNNNKLFFWFDRGIAEENKWLKAKKTTSRDIIRTKEYSKGFHLFKTKNAAHKEKRTGCFDEIKHACIRKVLYKELILSGLDYNEHKVILANKIKIMETK